MKQSERQRGSILLLTAVLLPILIAMVGLAIDTAHLYAQQIRLQNAADAAVLAAAKEYSQGNTNYGNFGNQFLAEDYGKLPAIDSHFNYLIETDQSGDSYMTLACSDDVELFFLKIMPGIGDTTTVAVASKAIIDTTVSDGNPFPNLITFSGTMLDIERHPPQSFYTGDIVATSNSANKPNHKLYTDKTETTETKVITDTSYSIEAYQDDTIKPLLKDSSRVYTIPSDNEHIYASNQISYMVDSLHKDVMYYNAWNPGDIHIDKAIPGSEEPIYIVIENTGAPELIIEDTYSSKDYQSGYRPYVVSYLGTGQLKVRGNGKFQGIIYAPNAQVLINQNSTSFYGSIVAKDVYVQGQGTYAYHQYDKVQSSMSSGNSGSGSGFGSGGTVRLVPLDYPKTEN